MLTCGALHVGYFLFAALAAAFLQIPPATRLALFLLVSLNASMEIQYGHSLDFASISLFLFIVCLGKLFIAEISIDHFRRACDTAVDILGVRLFKINKYH